MDDSPKLYFGSGAACQRLLEDAAAFAPAPCPILLVGATGTGKTVFARHLHGLSQRRNAPFVECPIPMIAPSLRHGALVGYRRGAFTGALRDHKGYLECAHGGTLLLDELGFVDRHLQRMLLTLLETNHIRRLHDERETPVDIRFIFATTADLPDMLRRGRILPEFYYRLGGFVLRLPELRERPDDVLPLAIGFLTRAFQRLNRAVTPEFDTAAGECLTEALWPGNIRQLDSVCWHIAVRVTAQRPIVLGDLPVEALGWELGPAGPGDSAEPKEQARAAVARHGGNKRRAARELRVSPTTLYRLLREERSGTDIAEESRRSAGRK